jgi:hypothetical protein
VPSPSLLLGLSALLLTGSTLALGAGEALTVQLTPEMGFAPADVVVKASVEAHSDNRALELILDSPDFYRSSLVELQGEQAPRTTVFEVRSVPGGRYVVTTRLLGPSGAIRSAVRHTLRVVSPFESIGDGN